MRHLISTSLMALSISAVALLLSATAKADSPPFYFELNIKQQRIPMVGNSQLESNSFGLRYQENLTENVGVNMALGRQSLDHQNNANALGFSPSGHHAGLGLTANTAEKYRFQAGIDISYHYFDNNQYLNGERVKISWNQAEARLWLAIQLSPQFKAYGCAFAISLDGKQKVSSTTTVVTQLDNKDKTGQCGGLSWQTEDHGFIGIEANGGAMRGGRIYFGRWFD